MWKLWNADGNLHPGQSQVKNIHFVLLFCSSENKSSVEALMQCLWIILRHDFWTDKISVCLVLEGIYIYLYWWGGADLQTTGKVPSGSIKFKERRHLCSSQLLFPQLKPKQSTWINSTTGNRENVYFWFEDLERGLFLLSRYPLLHLS